MLGCESSISVGELAIGLLDVLRQVWHGNAAMARKGKQNLEFSILFPARYRVVVYASNHEGPSSIEAELFNFSLERVSGALGAVKYQARATFNFIVRYSREHLKPNFYHARIFAQKQFATLTKTVSPLLSWLRVGRSYQLTDYGIVGYAVRSLAFVKGRSGRCFLVSSDFGDDTLSFLEYSSLGLGRRRVVRFPKMSAPLPLVALPREQGDDLLLMGLFNLDQSGTDVSITSLVMVAEIEEVIHSGVITAPDKQLPILAAREGFWGYRGLSCLATKVPDIYCVAAVDRHAGIFQTFTIDIAQAPRILTTSTLELPPRLEPIGIGVLRNEDGNRTAFFLNSRHFENLYTVHEDSSGALRVVDVTPLGGQSRTSVVVGNFGEGKGYSVVVGLWGGDPLEMNHPHRGQIVIAEIDDSLRVSGVRRFTAGVHPTDVACGDFDGDGVDELAVLNYGTGLGPGDRSNSGGIEIFKHVNGEFRCVGRIAVANPRIAKVMDIDGDGCDELLVSLFFEKKVVVIKLI